LAQRQLGPDAGTSWGHFPDWRQSEGRRIKIKDETFKMTGNIATINLNSIAD
jgi:hypothetical protein